MNAGASMIGMGTKSGASFCAWKSAARLSKYKIKIFFAWDFVKSKIPTLKLYIDFKTAHNLYYA